jgi:hypothetical protein
MNHNQSKIFSLAEMLAQILFRFCYTYDIPSQLQELILFSSTATILLNIYYKNYLLVNSNSFTLGGRFDGGNV